jgi:hypothetical protein
MRGLSQRKDGHAPLNRQSPTNQSTGPFDAPQPHRPLRRRKAAALHQLPFPALDRLEVDGIIRRERGVVEIEPEARALVRAVAATFDSYRAPSPRRQHSLAL